MPVAVDHLSYAQPTALERGISTTLAPQPGIEASVNSSNSSSSSSSTNVGPVRRAKKGGGAGGSETSKDGAGAGDTMIVYEADPNDKRAEWCAVPGFGASLI